MSKKKKNRPHVWSGAGYVCRDCGAIKDREIEKDDCTGDGSRGFDVWYYHAGAGWWLASSQVESVDEASAMLTRNVGLGNIVAGVILPAGNPLGLFTKRWDKK